MRYCSSLTFFAFIVFASAEDSFRTKRGFLTQDRWSLLPESLLRFHDHAREFTSRTLDELLAEASKEAPVRRRISPFDGLFGRESVQKETKTRPVSNKERETEGPEPSEVFIEEPHKPSPDDEVAVFNHPFSIPFTFNFGLFTPWWKGPNVCIDRNEVDEPEKDGNMTIFSINFESTQCMPTENAYVCTKRTLTNGMRKTIIVKYQCCHGFIRRSDGKPGCSEAKMDDIMTTLKSVEASRFAGMIESSGLIDKLLAENFTVFAPLNEDLMDFEEESEDNEILAAKPSTKKDKDTSYLVGGHIVEGFVNLHSAINDQVLQSLNGKTTIRINKYHSARRAVTANCVPVSTENHFATNGMVHLISDILPLPRKTIADVVTGGTQFSIFANLLRQSDLMDELSNSEKSWTLFLPTDDAFNSMDKTMLQKLLSGEGCADSILRHHFAKGTICSSAVTGRVRVSSLLGKPLFMTVDESKKIKVDDAQMNTTDILATNGVVHVIDEVLIPPEAHSILETLKKSGRSDLLELIESAGLVSQFDNMQNVTFFVPSKDAIKDVPEGTLASWKEDLEKLKDVLLFHVATPQISAADFMRNKEMATLADNQNINIKINDMFLGIPVGAAVQCSMILSHDNAACGATLHTVEKMMTPPKGSIMEVLKSMDGHNITKKLLELTNLEKKLEDEGEGPYTLLAPTDEAFERFEKKSLDELLENKTRAEPFLRMHILPEALCCNSVNDMLPFRHHYVRTMEGNLLPLHRRHGSLRFGPARAVRCDTAAKNGLIHSVNRVILPSRRQVPSVFDIDLFRLF